LLRLAVVAGLAAALLAASVARGAPVLSRQQPISVGERVITLDRLEHWARIVARTTGRRTVAADFQEAASFLVDSTWIEAEAELRRIEVSDSRVERDLRRQIRESFPGGAGFRHFLRVSGQTRADLAWRVRVRLLSDAIRRQVIGDAKTPRGQQRRVDRFLAEFRARWRSQTFCTPRFARLPDRCANAPA
jgi:hypothetical protein